MNYIKYQLLVIFIVVNVAVYAQSSLNFNPRRQPPVTSSPGKIRIYLKSKEHCTACPTGERLQFGVQRSDGENGDFFLANDTAQVDALYIVGTSEGIVVGRVLASTSIISLVNIESGKLLDSFYCFSPSVSPNKKYIAFEKVFPAHFNANVSAEYMLYNLQKSPQENRQVGTSINNKIDVGTAIYPPGSRNTLGDNLSIAGRARHTMLSDTYYWSAGSSRVAFADRSGGKLSIVLVHLEESGVKVNNIGLNTSGIVQVDRCPEFRSNPEESLRVSKIIFLPNKSFLKIQISSIAPGCAKSGMIVLHII